MTAQEGCSGAVSSLVWIIIRKQAAGRRNNLEAIEIKDLTEEYEKVVDYVRHLPDENKITESISSETLLVLEALCHKINGQKDSRTKVTIQGRKKLGSVSIRIGYEGGVFNPAENAPEEILSEEILTAYADKIGYSYREGYNKILITVSRNKMAFILPCFIGIVLATVAYIPFCLSADVSQKQYLLNTFIFPFEKMFANAIMMAGTPVVFFSLLRNLTNAFIVSERESGMGRLQFMMGMSSIISVLLAIGTGFLFRWIVGDLDVPFYAGRHLKIEMSLPEFISSLVPPDILAPFQTFSPFPLIVVAVIMTYAFCFSERYFDRMMNVVDMCYVLFSKMLGIIMCALPFFFTVAFIEFYLNNGYKVLLYLAGLTFGLTISTFVMIGYYSVRIMMKRIPVIPFLKKMTPLLRENLSINSPIDAAPYNIRYCETNYNMDRRKLKMSMPLLAQINLDGNCFFIMLIMLEYNAGISALNVVLVAVIVLFLSLGAPNQPGSVLIAMTVILNYMNAHDLIPLAFFCEVFYGRLLNAVNVMGDVVTVAEKQEKRSFSKKLLK